MSSSSVLGTRGRAFFAFVVVLATIVSPTPRAGAEVREYDVVIKAIDPIAGTVVVHGNGRDVTFRVGDATAIRSGSEQSSIEKLTAGAEARISFETTTGELLSIDAAPTPNPHGAPKELIALELKEIDVATKPMAAWPSQDGLRIYWEAEGKIWCAERKDVRATFGERRQVALGRHPTLSADELEIVLSIDRKIYSSRRRTVEESFERPRPIAELVDSEGAAMPSISSDGLNLYFMRNRKGGEGLEVVVASRPTRDSAWTKSRVILTSNKSRTGYLTWPFVSEDGLTMLMTLEGDPDRLGVVEFRRQTESMAFERSVPLELPLPPAVWRSPRYVEATGELFLTKFELTGSVGQKPSTIWVVEGVVWP